VGVCPPGRRVKRSRPLRRKTKLAPGTKRLPTVNPARQAKRRQSYTAKLRAMKQGPGYLEAMQRAGGRCEMLFRLTGRDCADEVLRCLNTERLAAHHVTYARFGGAELAMDLLIVCPTCHGLLESKHPTRKRGRAA
jgi:hypothetical protein